MNRNYYDSESSWSETESDSDQGEEFLMITAKGKLSWEASPTPVGDINKDFQTPVGKLLLLLLFIKPLYGNGP